MKRALPALLLLALPQWAVAGTARFALVVGNNTAPQPELPVLHYADDDAARLYEFLMASGQEARLLTVLDADTQALMPTVVQASSPPTRAQVVAAMESLQVGMARAQARGDTVEFTFAFAGHGQGSAGGGGAVFLQDGPFTRSDLHDLIVRPAKADFIHIIVDACDSYFMVASRGASSYPEDRVDAAAAKDLVQAYLDGDGPAQDPRTGFLVSTNQAAKSHEYDGFRAGVFSHVIHGALAGAADSNGDGRVEYSEVLAYAAAASQDIRDPRARLSIHGRPPPRDVHRAVMDLATSRFTHFLRLGPEVEGRLHVEDARTVRYADVNKPAGSNVLLALVDSSSYRVVKPDGVSQVVLARERQGTLKLGAFGGPDTRARGGLEDALRGELFSTPYDGSFYRGFVASQGMSPARVQGGFNPPDAAQASFIPQRPRLLFGIPGVLAMGAGGVMGAAAGLTTVFTKFAYDAYAASLRTNGVVDDAQESRINMLRVATGVLVAAGMGMLALGGILVAVELLWPVKTAHEEGP